jgi:hypothetical protein
MKITLMPKYHVKRLPNYSAVIPSYIKCFPEYLRMNGYYATNNVKDKLDGDIVNVSSPYTVYQGGTIKLRKGETLIVNAMRIGYSPAIVKYIY